MRAATYLGATSVVLSLIGFLRWVFVVPPLAHAYVTGDATAQTAAGAAWTAQHQFGGSLLGEHLGQLLVIGWSVTLCVIIVRSRVLPRWLGITGLAVSTIYLLNQGDILATAVPGFPVWDLAGLLGSTSWGLWVAALGVTLLRRPVSNPNPGTTDAPLAGISSPRQPITVGPGADGRASDYFGPHGGAQSNLGDRVFPAAIAGKQDHPPTRRHRPSTGRPTPRQTARHARAAPPRRPRQSHRA